MVLTVIVFFWLHAAVFADVPPFLHNGLSSDDILRLQIRQVEEKAGRYLIGAKAKADALERTLRDLEAEIDEYIASQTKIGVGIEFMVKYTSCNEIYNEGYRDNGVYSIWLPSNFTYLPVYCDMSFNGPTGLYGWMLIQSRETGKEDFHQNYVDYEDGFGNPHREFWIGLKNIHMLTNDFDMNQRGEYRKIRFMFENWDGFWGYVIFAQFQIADSSLNYAIRKAFDPFVSKMFKKNRDVGNFRIDRIFSVNTGFISSFDTPNSCGWNGGWWFQHCQATNPTGKFPDGHVDGPMQKYMSTPAFGLLRRFAISLQ